MAEEEKTVHHYFPKTIMVPLAHLGCSNWSTPTESVLLGLHPSDTLNLTSR